jgi:dephospho-CoA kinase
MFVKIIGITGGTGAGKTTALRALKDLNALVIDADQIYHDLTKNSPNLRRDLEKRFGDVYGADACLDRKKLGNIVFNDPNALKDLNAMTHRYVGEEIDRLLAKARVEGRKVAAIDAIALIESGLGEKCDYKIAVTAPADLRIKRIMAREGITEEYAHMRVLAQKDEVYYEANCDYILVNREEDTAERFSARALELFRQILAQ